jgi:hypothetical protein
MINTIFLVICAMIVTPLALSNDGSLTWSYLGTTLKNEIAGGNGGVTVSSNSVSFLQQYAPRVYLMNSAGNSFYRFPSLLGKSLRFTVDVSKTSCGCNAALYFVQFPSSASESYYCDAQGSSSANNLCAEIDIVEANIAGLQSTLHCNAGSQYCEWGCAWNVKSAQNYGQYASGIDTTKPFQVDYSFVESGNTLSAIEIKLSQSGKSGLSSTITDSTCSWMNLNMVSELSSAVTSGELVLAISYWGGNMNWLDGCSSENCPTSSTATFSNFQVLSGVTAVTTDESATMSSIGGLSAMYIGIICLVVAVVLVALIVIVIVRRKKVVEQERV